MTTRTDPWPVDRTHAAPSVPPPASWRPIRVGAFYYATNGARMTSRNFVMRDACVTHCAELNA